MRFPGSLNGRDRTAATEDEGEHMARRRNVINGLVFFAPIGIVASAIPQAPDYTAIIGWGLALLMLVTAGVLALRSPRPQRDADVTAGAPARREAGATDKAC